MADAYLWARNHGVEYQYADMFPDLIGEGPKTWAYAKFLWNVDADPDALVTDWCTAVAGAGGAALEQYYTVWRNFWSTDILDTPYWAFGRGRTNVPFTVCGYLDALPLETVTVAGALLDDSLEAADQPAQRRRIELIRRRHQYVEQTVASYPRPVAPPSSILEALALVARVETEVDDAVAAASQRRVIAAEDEVDPVTRRQFNYDSTLFWTGYNGELFFRILDFAQDTDDPSEIIDALAGIADNAPDEPRGRFSQFLLNVLAGTRSSIVPNHHFEDGDVVSAPPWTVKNNARRSEGTGRGGSTSMLMWSEEGTDSTTENSIIQQVPASVGLVAGRVWFRLRATTGPIEAADVGLVSLKWHFMTASGSNIVQSVQPMRFGTDGQDDWAWIAVMDDVPSTFLEQSVGRLRLVISLLSHRDACEVHLDDVQVLSETVVRFGAPALVHYGTDSEILKDEYESEKNDMEWTAAQPNVGLVSETNLKEGPALAALVSDLIAGVIQGRKSIADWKTGVTEWRTRGGDAIRGEFEKAFENSVTS